MRHYFVTVELGGSKNHVVANKLVTVPEIAVLTRIHGEGSVTGVRPAKLDPDDERNDRALEGERERLRAVYDGAGTDDAGSVVDHLWGPMARLPTTLAEIGIDPRIAADEMRRKAAEMAAAADTLQDEAPPPEDDEEDFFADDPPAAAPAKAAKALEKA